MILAYDLEALRNAVDWSEDDKRSMGVACVGVQALTGETWLAVERAAAWAACRGIADHVFAMDAERESELQALFDAADVLVSFNGGDEAESGFDNVVLAGADIMVNPAKCFDLRLQLKRANGGTLPKGCNLGAIAQANADPEFPSLGCGKTGNGGDAPKLWADGKYREVAEYCLRGDVQMTADLYRKLRRDGYLLLPDGSRVEIPAKGAYDGKSKTAAAEMDGGGDDLAGGGGRLDSGQPDADAGSARLAAGSSGGNLRVKGSKGKAGKKAKKSAPARDLSDLALIRRLTPKLPDSAMKIEYRGYSFEFRRSYHRKGFANPYGTAIAPDYFTINRSQWREMKERLSYAEITELIAAKIAAREAELRTAAGL